MHQIEHRRLLGPKAWVGVALLAALVACGALALSATDGRRALIEQLQRPATPARGPAAATRARVIRRSIAGYSLAVTITPNRATGPIDLSIRVLGHGRPVTGARVRVGFSMPSMNMSNAYTAPLRASAGGHYAAAIPVLGMVGRWRLRFELTPRSGRPFHVVLDDRIAP